MNELAQVLRDLGDRRGDVVVLVGYRRPRRFRMVAITRPPAKASPTPISGRCLTRPGASRAGSSRPVTRRSLTPARTFPSAPVRKPTGRDRSADGPGSEAATGEPGKGGWLRDEDGAEACDSARHRHRRSRSAASWDGEPGPPRWQGRFGRAAPTPGRALRTLEGRPRRRFPTTAARRQAPTKRPGCCSPAASVISSPGPSRSSA